MYDFAKKKYFFAFVFIIGFGKYLTLFRSVLTGRSNNFQNFSNKIPGSEDFFLYPGMTIIKKRRILNLRKSNIPIYVSVP